MRLLKRTHQRVVRTSISMHPDLMRTATRAQSDAGFPGFSDYIQHLIRDAAIRERTRERTHGE